MPKEKIAIIGSGFSGISIAIHLNRVDRELHIFESTSRVGGRAYSFKDKKTGLIFDNGQHLLMGAYHETLYVLKRLNVLHKIDMPKQTNISYYTKRHGIYSLKSLPFLPAPFHLAYSLLFDFKPLSFSERLRLLIVAFSLFKKEGRKLKNTTVKQWLINLKQNKNTIRYVWNLIAESTMNDSIENLSAHGFKHILRILFIQNRNNAIPILSKVGLSELTQNAFLSFLKRNNHSIVFNATVKKIYSGRKVKIKIRDTYHVFDKLIMAVPHFSAKKIFPQIIPNLKTTSILSIYFSTDKALFNEIFIGFPEHEIQWIFNKTLITGCKKNLYAATISHADRFMNHSKGDLEHFFKHHLVEIFPYAGNINIYKIIHEKRATFSDIIGADKMRLFPSEIQENVFICGDWTQTKLPATIESACLSGKILANKLNNQIRDNYLYFK